MYLTLYLFLSLPLTVQDRGPIVLVDPVKGPLLHNELFYYSESFVNGYVILTILAFPLIRGPFSGSNCVQNVRIEQTSSDTYRIQVGILTFFTECTRTIFI
jgi:hypothetical protein